MRMLVVGAEPHLAKATAESLRREGYAVDVAFDGRAALVKARVHAYDLVCLDLDSPEADGRAIARELRNGERWDEQPPPRLLVIGGQNGVAERIGVLDAGADDYLVKPVELTELAARVRALLRRAPAMSGAIMHVGDLELDTARHEARRAGRPLDLTPKEFALLRYLMAHRGEVLSEGHLLTHVWDEHANPFSKTVRVTLMTLRRKLTADGETQPIETVVVAGYRLRGPP
jgi:DNA-binding response OmpR family regulator